MKIHAQIIRSTTIHFTPLKTFHRTNSHDRSGNDMRGRKWNAVKTRTLNDERSGCLRRETMHRLQFHHAVTERANNPPATRSSSRRHRRGAYDLYPHRDVPENRRVQKLQPRGQMLEAACLGRGKERKRNDAHCFLRVVGAVTVRHPCRAEDL